MKNLKTLFVSSDIFYLLIIFIMLILVDSVALQVGVLIFMFIWLTRMFYRLPLVLICGCLFFLLRLNITYPKPEFKHAVITKVTETQTTFSNGFFYANSFGTEYGKLGEKVELEYELLPHPQSQYQQGLLLKNNVGILKINQSKHIRQSNLPQVVLGALVQKLPSQVKDVASFYIYQDGDYNALDSSLYTAMLSNGIHLSASLAILKSIISKKFEEQQTSQMILVISVFYGFLFGWGFVTIRLIIQSLLSRTSIKGQNRTFLEMAIILFLYPMALSANAFILIYAIKLTGFIIPEAKEFVLTRFSYLAFIQLNLFFRFNPVESLLFRFFRQVSGSMFLLSGLSLILPVGGLLVKTHNVLLKMLTTLELNHLTIVGRPNLLVNGLWVMSILFVNHKVLKELVSPLLIYGQTLFLMIDSSVHIVYLDVGQGDATLITYPHRQGALLIDTGKANQYSTLEKSLHMMGIKSISTLLITHADEDHDGNQAIVQRRFNVNQTVVNTNQEIVAPINFKLLNIPIKSDDRNDHSLILFFRVDELSFLFTGDASSLIEKELIKEFPLLSVDILKLGHHGSKTSNSPIFLNSVKPLLAVVSSDPKIYNHPHPEVLRRLYDLKINHLETSQSGSIEVVITKFFAYVKNHGNNTIGQSIFFISK